MKLPNGELAIVDIVKLREYCLNPHHYRGRHKARVFASINIHQDDSDFLRDAILTAAREAEARPGDTNQYGQRYGVDFELVSRGKRANIRTLWICGKERMFPASRLVMYYKRRRCLMAGIEMHSVVALLEDLSGQGLARGQVGVVVGEWAPGVYEVEFSDNDGKTYALVALKAEQLLTLHHEPTHQAA